MSRCLHAALALLLLTGAPTPAAGQEAVPAWPRKKDPKPLVTAAYLDVKLSISRGKVSVLTVKKGAFPKGPKLITRFRGSHTLSLHSHGKLLDLVRFDFPLTAGSGEKTPAHEKLGEGLARGASAVITVRMPWDDRATRVDLTDSKGGKAVAVPLQGIVIEEKVKTKNFRAATFQPRKKKAKKKKPGTRNQR